jgi:hypothetical protein
MNEVTVPPIVGRPPVNCADACHRCAQECESFDTDVDMKICFDACQKSEETCRNMVKAMGVAS